jgi:hypothetical protein
MPTGYTSDLYDGKEVTFQNFVLHCARALNVFVELREEPQDEPIPDLFTPNSFHDEQRRAAEAKIARLEGLSDEEADELARSSYETAKREFEELVASRTQRRGRYLAMLTQVRQWTPPSPDHEGLKAFMIQQLEDSMQSDCDMTFITAPELQTAAEYKEQLLAAARRSLEYHAREYRMEVERVAKRNQWVRLLRQSLANSASETSRSREH